MVHGCDLLEKRAGRFVATSSRSPGYLLLLPSAERILTGKLPAEECEHVAVLSGADGAFWTPAMIITDVLGGCQDKLSEIRFDVSARRSGEESAKRQARVQHHPYNDLRCCTTKWKGERHAALPRRRDAIGNLGVRSR